MPDTQFIAVDVQAALESSLEYTPIVAGVPSLLRGGAAFPGNNWTRNPRGEAYLGRIPPQSHQALGQIRDFHLRFTRNALRKLRGDDADDDGDSHGASRRLRHKMMRLTCR